MKISEAFDEYRRREVRGRGGSINTDQGYYYAKNAVVKYFGDMNIKKLNADRVNEFYLDLVESKGQREGQKPLTQNAARRYVSCIRSVLSMCYNRGMSVENPNNIIIPKMQKKAVRFVTLKEYSKFLDAANTPIRGYSTLNRVRNTLIVKMLFYTGLRVGELCALDRDSIRERQFVVVGKSKQPRVCFITRELENDITKYLSMRTDSNPALFISDQVGSRVTVSTVQRVFRRLAGMSGLPKVTPHTMRHSFATRLVEDGVDIRYVATLLGHQSIATTQCYTHVRDQKLQEIYINTMEG